MNKILEGVARAICLAIWDHDYTPRDPKYPDVRWIWAMDAAKAGAGFLADNVSDEMVRAATEDRAKDDEGLFPALGDQLDYSGENKTRTVVKSAIAAALRAAAEGE